MCSPAMGYAVGDNEIMLMNLKAKLEIGMDDERHPDQAHLDRLLIQKAILDGASRLSLLNSVQCGWD